MTTPRVPWNHACHVTVVNLAPRVWRWDAASPRRVKGARWTCSGIQRSERAAWARADEVCETMERCKVTTKTDTRGFQ